jgi:hypothetical protein
MTRAISPFFAEIGVQARNGSRANTVYSLAAEMKPMQFIASISSRLLDKVRGSWAASLHPGKCAFALYVSWAKAICLSREIKSSGTNVSTPMRCQMLMGRPPMFPSMRIHLPKSLTIASRDITGLAGKASLLRVSTSRVR